MENNEIFEIASSLEQFHGIFSQFWSLGNPVFTSEIPTAAISFSDINRPIFLLNKEYWDTCSLYKKQFIICHECLHVLLNHGIRGKDLENQSISNIAMDIAVNHMLVNNFGFNRDQIEGWENYCWTDTIPELGWCKSDLHFEYYYNILKSKLPKQLKVILVDSHDNFGKSDVPEEFSDKLKEEVNKLSDPEKQILKEVFEKEDNDSKSDRKAGQIAGTIGGNIVKSYSITNVKKKKKWETVIKKWYSKYIKQDFRSKEQWARTNRRFLLLDQNLFIPTEMEVDQRSDEKTKIDVWFYLDTSGSCAHLGERFFKAALSIPPEKFNVKLFCFDTSVYKVDIKKQQLYGFGGTSFRILEEYIQRNIKSKKEYPKAIFVITDGYGDYIHPEFPDRWYWFLTDSYKFYLPKESKIYSLSNFE